MIAYFMPLLAVLPVIPILAMAAMAAISAGGYGWGKHNERKQMEEVGHQNELTQEKARKANLAERRAKGIAARQQAMLLDKKSSEARRRMSEKALKDKILAGSGDAPEVDDIIQQYIMMAATENGGVARALRRRGGA